MAPRYRIRLSQQERDELTELSQKGKRSAKTVLYARALLLLDEGEYGPNWTTAKVSEAIGISTRSLEFVKKRCIESGPLAAIERKQRETPPREIIFGGEFEAQLIALACSDPPEGRERWTIRLLAEQLVELKIVSTVSPMTVCNTLKKTNFDLTKAGTGKSRRMEMQHS